MPIKYLFLSLLSLILSACGSVAMMQASCERTSATFTELAACINWSVAASANARMQNSPEVKLYMLKADQLSQRVKRQEMSDMDARAELQSLYANLKSLENARRAAGVTAYNASCPKTTNCCAADNTVQCNSY